MLRARYSWRPLGALLVEKGLLTEQELDAALAEQRRTGRLVGQILVERGSLSAFALARALSEQHGVMLQTEAELDAKASRNPGWRPLGRLLVDDGYLTRAELRKALRTQRESGGRRLLGEILVAEGFLSGIALARALAEQNGFELGPDGAEPVQAVLSSAPPSHMTYQVCVIALRPAPPGAGRDLRERELPRSRRLRRRSTSRRSIPTASRSTVSTARPARPCGRTAPAALRLPQRRRRASRRPSASTRRCGARPPPSFASRKPLTSRY